MKTKFHSCHNHKLRYIKILVILREKDHEHRETLMLSTI